MPNVFDVAKYMLEKRGPMSAMKIQKLCYYAQAWYLVWEDAHLFEEDFYAWESGPVCIDSFDKTRGKYMLRLEDETGGTGYLTETQKEIIDKVLDFYAPHDAQWLGRLASLESPWKNAKASELPNSNIPQLISKDSIKKYYFLLSKENNNQMS